MEDEAKAAYRELRKHRKMVNDCRALQKRIDRGETIEANQHAKLTKLRGISGASSPQRWHWHMTDGGTAHC